MSKFILLFFLTTKIEKKKYQVIGICSKWCKIGYLLSRHVVDRLQLW